MSERLKRWPRRLLVAAGAVVAMGALAYGYGLWEARQVRVVEVELFFDDLPPAFDGLRIVQVSDLHTRRFGAVERRLQERLKNIEADLLVATGDFRATLKTPPAKTVASLKRIFAGLDYPWGLVACPGDHDAHGFWERFVAETRFTGLLRQTLILSHQGQEVALLGTVTARPLDWIRGEHEIDEATWARNVMRRNGPWGILPDTPARPLDADRLNGGEGFRILLAHDPDHLTPAHDAGIALVLSGDTHGGQVRLPLIGSLYRKGKIPGRYDRGHYALGETQMYVNPGIGTKYVPIRILCPPEITVLTLRRAPAEGQ